VALRRGLGIILAFIGTASLVSILGLVALYFIVGREPSVPAKSTLVLRVGAQLAELPPDLPVSPFIGNVRPPSLRTLIENIDKARVDPRISALIVAPSRIGVPYWGKIQEIRAAITDFKRSGKPAVAYLEYGGDREYYLATACDKIFLMPTSTLDLAGVATYEVFLRGTLDKIGAYPDLHHIGDYKTATNQMTEKTFTTAHREMTESLNRDAYDQLVRAIADGRQKSEADVRALVDDGPFLAEAAVRAGLVDDIAYEDQLDDKVKFNGAEKRLVETRDYNRINPTSLGLNKGPRIAVLYAVGTIVSGRSGFDPINGPVVGSDTFVEHLEQIRSDPSVKAVVLRIDSPGGSTIASDVIWRELMVTRDAKPERPLVVSMSDLAASGGYYIAMPAQVIVADPGTLTGSIGIFGGKVVTGGIYEKLGAHLEAVSTGRNAEMDSPIRPYNDSEKAKVEEQLQSFYDQFVTKVAQARHSTPEKIHAVAQGRVWTGRQARQIGLVDELGGLERAVVVAKQRAKIPVDSEVELVIFPPRRSWYEVVSDQLGDSDESWIRGFSRGLEVFASPAERQAIAALTAPMRLFARGEPLALMPFTLIR
jgi:protease-4